MVASLVLSLCLLLATSSAIEWMYNFEERLRSANAAIKLQLPQMAKTATTKNALKVKQYNDSIAVRQRARIYYFLLFSFSWTVLGYFRDVGRFLRNDRLCERGHGL